MTIASEVQRIKTNIANAYTSCNSKGATMPASQVSDNLATCISSIPTATEPTLASLTITPSTTAQTLTPPSGTDGYNTVTVSAVTASIDNDIQAGNIKSGVEILGVSGTVTELVGTTTTITQNGTYAPASPSNGFTSVSVNVAGTQPSGTYTITANGTYDVTDYASADVNVSGGGYPTGNYYVMNDGSIQPLYFYEALLLDSQNNQVIKNNVCFSPDFTTMNELTETGKAYTHPSYAPENLTAYSIKMGNFGNLPNNPSFPILLDEVKHVNLSGVNGKIWFQDSSIFPAELFTSLESIDMSNAINVWLREVFNGAIVKTVDLSSVIEISEQYAMQRAFIASQLETIDLSSLTTVSGIQAMNYAFQNCTGLTSVDLSSLTTVSGGNAMQQAFYNCKGLTSIDLSSLTTVSGVYAMRAAFQNCTGLTSVDLSSLTTVGDKAFMNAFSGSSLTSLSFPALTSTSFGNFTNQFNLMLRQVTGCTVHFPSNLQSVIGSWSDVIAGFGGTNTTVLFDLPATT